MTRSGGTLLAVGVVGHHPDGHGGGETATLKTLLSLFIVGLLA